MTAKHGPHHIITVHAHGHSPRIRQLAHELVQAVRDEGVDVSHAGVLTDGEHVELHHAPTGEHEIKD
jgi:hypothetical protein